MRTNGNVFDPFAMIREEFERCLPVAKPRSSSVQEDSVRRHEIPLTYEASDEGLTLNFEVPGVQLEDICLQVDEGVLTVEAERTPPKDCRVLRNERRFGKLGRRLQLPEIAAPETVDASLEDGVLTVTLGNRKEKVPQPITIRSAGTPGDK